jgi:hypothetical protein
MSKASLRKTIMSIKEGDSFTEDELDVIFKGIGENVGISAKWAFDDSLTDSNPRTANASGAHIWARIFDKEV